MMKKTVHKLKNKPVETLYNPSYNFRINLKKEIEVNPYSNKEGELLLRKWKQLNKSFRYKKRYSFMTKNKLFRVDVTIRIHDKAVQARMFDLLGFTPEEAEAQFGFLMNAFQYGAPPHGGLALGFDRLCSLFGGSDSIRDFIAFPKNNSGRDVMIDAPSPIHDEQYNELFLQSTAPAKDE